eukprot:766464-Hanusia_phi.AAC.3
MISSAGNLSLCTTVMLKIEATLQKTVWEATAARNVGGSTEGSKAGSRGQAGSITSTRVGLIPATMFLSLSEQVVAVDALGSFDPSTPDELLSENEGIEFPYSSFVGREQNDLRYWLPPDEELVAKHPGFLWGIDFPISPLETRRACSLRKNYPAADGDVLVPERHALMEGLRVAERTGRRLHVNGDRLANLYSFNNLSEHQPLQVGERVTEPGYDDEVVDAESRTKNVGKVFRGMGRRSGKRRGEIVGRSI